SRGVRRKAPEIAIRSSSSAEGTLRASSGLWASLTGPSLGVARQLEGNLEPPAASLWTAVACTVALPRCFDPRGGQHQPVIKQGGYCAQRPAAGVAPLAVRAVAIARGVDDERQAGARRHLLAPSALVGGGVVVGGVGG